MTADASTSPKMSSCSIQTGESLKYSQIIYLNQAKNDQARKDEMTQDEARRKKERALEESTAEAAAAIAVVKLDSNEASDEDEDFILVDLKK